MSQGPFAIESVEMEILRRRIARLERELAIARHLSPELERAERTMVSAIEDLPLVMMRRDEVTYHTIASWQAKLDPVTLRFHMVGATKVDDAGSTAFRFSYMVDHPEMFDLEHRTMALVAMHQRVVNDAATAVMGRRGEKPNGS
jgi:hypothetical protein